jgi:hypothetical protein
MNELLIKQTLWEPFCGTCDQILCVKLTMVLVSIAYIEILDISDSFTG